MARRRMVFLRALPQRWLQVGSIVVSFAALALLAAAFSTRFSGRFSSLVLLTLVLLTLVGAIALHVFFLLLARTEQRETARALDATELEYKSVFDNALDGIVVFDDHGICLEANPAALALFGREHQVFAGQPIGRLFSEPRDLESTWKDFVDGKYAHNEARILRPDGTAVFVEYTAKANYLLGRHVAVLRDITKRKEAEVALRESEERFQQMASNIQEIFWMLDTENKKVIYVNKAYETITGRRLESLRENPKACEEAIHPADRIRVLSRLEESVHSGQLDEEFRIVMPDGAIRWVWVRGFPVRDSCGTARRMVGTAQDVTARKSAEEQIARNLDMAESAWAEAEAFRKTSLALTQNLSMDYVLDTLLESLLDLVPCESAQVLLVEAGTRLFLAREVRNYRTDLHAPEMRVTLDARENRSLMQVLATGNSLLIADTAEEAQWAKFAGFSHLRSWLCVPLVAAQRVLGFLSLGDREARAFTEEHLRLARSLAIPAAVAIQNARLYEQAEIFRGELEQRLAGLERTEKVTNHPHHSGGGRPC
jgi:PAS domain S-box-containing protein